MEYYKKFVFMQNLIPKVVDILRERDNLDLMINFYFLTKVPFIN